MKKRRTHQAEAAPLANPSLNENNTPMENTIEPQESKPWDIITALSHVLEEAQDSELSDEFWEKCKPALDYLHSTLDLKPFQSVAVAILAEEGNAQTWRNLSRFLECSRIRMMTYTGEIEELINRRFVERRTCHQMGREQEGFILADGFLEAIQHNQMFVPEKIDGLDETQFMNALEARLDKTLEDNDVAFCDNERWMVQLAKANPQLPLCQQVLSYDDIHVQALLLLVAYDYAQWAGNDAEGLTSGSINHYFPEERECGNMRKQLKAGTHVLITEGIIEQKYDSGYIDVERYSLTERSKNELLGNYVPSRSATQQTPMPVSKRGIKSYADIKAKDMFYNDSEQEQIDRLVQILEPDNFPAIQERLEQEGMRKGFATIFYGGPGTGKTETALQIARRTGRDIMQVNIASIRDKYVGESEKNIKGLFNHYREVCKRSDVAPILFFNEADAIFNKRNENAERSVDKMDNSIQNIILQELEDLDGILIATTNLTSNLDSAFERRFLFKIKFDKPETKVKAKIWKSMLKDLSEDDSLELAENYDFSGGQIENIARKRTIDYILTGKRASLKDIESFCDAELLSKDKDNKATANRKRCTVGFLTSAN